MCRKVLPQYKTCTIFNNAYMFHYIALTCPPNSVYSTCSKDCELTCVDYRNGGQQESACSGLPCVEGCMCESGFYQDGDSCVPAEECGCEYNGNYYKVRMAWVLCLLVWKGEHR